VESVDWERLSWEKSEDIDFLLDIFEKNQIVISTTDTIYGFLGNVSSESYDRICVLKEVAKRRPFIVFISSVDKIGRFADLDFVSDRIKRFIDACWPGPLTVILPAKKDSPDYMKSAENKVALRSPDHAGLQKLLCKIDGLFTTSANKERDPEPRSFDDLPQELLKKVGCVVTDGGEDGNLSSTIIDLTVDDELKVVREGAFPVERLKEIWEATHL